MKTLVVEDDFTNRLVLKSFLSRYGECDTVVTGEDALEAFKIARHQGSPYDLICMDVLMDGISGTETVYRVRDLEESCGIHSDRGVKIIMTTAVNEIRGVVDAFNALCDAYLTKPISTALLLDHLKNFDLI